MNTSLPSSFIASFSQVILLFTAAIFVSAQNPASGLELGKPVDGQLRGGESHFFQYVVKAGHFARVEVERRNVDVSISLFAPDGKLVVKVNGKDGRLWREAISYIAPKNGLYKLQIEGYQKTTEGGSYTVKLAVLRRATTGDRKRLVADLHFNAGQELRKQYKFAQAALEYESALLIWRGIGEAEWEAIALVSLGSTYRNLAKYDRSIASFEKAATIFQKNKDRIGESNAFNGLGVTYYTLGRHDLALANYEAALSILRGLKDRYGESVGLDNLGDISFRLGEYEKAIAYYQQALTITREIKDRDGEAYSFMGLGGAYRGLAQYERAGECYGEALNIYRETKARFYEGYVLMGLGNVSFNLAKYDEARSFYELALAINRETKDRPGEAATLVDLGNIYLTLSRYERAREHYQRALAIYRVDKNRAGEGAPLLGLAEVYYSVAQYGKARDYFEQGLVIVRESKDPRNEASALISLGNVCIGLEQYEKAASYFQQSLTLSRGIKDRSSEGIALNNLGEVSYRLAQYEKGREYLEQALKINREINDRYGESNVLTNLGKVHYGLSQYGKARAYYERALAISREVNLREVEGEVCENLLEFYERMKNPKLAILYGKEAVNVYQEIRGTISQFENYSKRSFLQKNIKIYRRLSDVLISEGRLYEAQAVLDLLKEEEFEKLKTRRNGEIPETIPYSKAEAEVIAKVENFAVLGRRQSELQNEKERLGDKFPIEKQQELEKIRVDIETATKAFRETIDALAGSERSVESQIADIKSERNLQRALSQLGKELKTGAVAIYSVISTEEKNDPGGQLEASSTRSQFGWLVLVTPDGRKAYPIDVSNLGRTVFQFRKALGSDKYDPRPLAEKLYNALFRQTSDKQKVTLEQDLRDTLDRCDDKTLMWSLDGVLRYIPIAALHDGKQYLVEKYRNVVFTKPSLLYLNEKDAASWQALGLGVSEPREGFTSLPGAEKELKDVVHEPAAATGILDGSIRLNNKFKKDETISLWRDGKFPVVHIASHYSFNASDQTASYLLVGDGKLTFADLQDKDLLFAKVDLLTLSACDTALTANGKEAEGFPYLAQQLGAKSVIASLWKVSDQGTPELMLRFYKLRAENALMTKAEAFQRAQLSLLNGETEIQDHGLTTKRSEVLRANGKKDDLKPFLKDAARPFAHPHYWASFVLIGNWR
jgi:CHAT domain-containing protein/uncharacterized protein HemY